MGPETHVRGWRLRALALFEVLALVALLGLQGAAASDAVAGRNEDHGERPDVERDCSAPEAVESQGDQDASDKGREPAPEAIACRDDSDADTEVDDEAGGPEPDEVDDHERDEVDTEVVDEAGGLESDAHEPDDADEKAEQEADDHETDKAEQGDDDHQADEADGGVDDEAGEAAEHEPAGGQDDQEAEELDEAEQPDDDVEPGASSGDVPEEEPPGPAETGPDQSGPGIDKPPTDAEATSESPDPTGAAGGSPGRGHQDNNSQGAGGSESGGSGSAEPGPVVGASRSGPRDPGSDEEVHDGERAPFGPTGVVSGYNLAGSFSTAALLDALPPAQALRARKRVPEVAPFIIAGPASWTNTWGAPRFGPGSSTRQHEGQDVFCRYGDPVLASESGYVEFDEGGLGGKVARLHRADGSYWYYAHLSAWNSRDFASGDRVARGDVIGYCGSSGNAAGSSPHVHFGFYGSDGRAIDPMTYLVGWLRAAERGLRLAHDDGRGSNRGASEGRAEAENKLTLASFVPRLPRLLARTDAFGDSSAVQESPPNRRLLESSSTGRIEVGFELLAIATLLLLSRWSRKTFSSA